MLRGSSTRAAPTNKCCASKAWKTNVGKVPHPVSSGRVQRMAGLAHRAAITVLSARDKNVSFSTSCPAAFQSSQLP